MNSKLLASMLLATIAAVSSAQAPTGVRGRIESISGSKLEISTPTGIEHVKLAKDAKAYGRQAASRDKFAENSFVGITSVKTADGAEVATEIHIFPDELKGLGEGSRMMGTNGPGGRPNRMTNGTVKQMGVKEPSRMTNGTVKQESRGTVTLAYKGGTRVIEIPNNVMVTMISPMPISQLKVGMNVFALGDKQKDGTWLAHTIMMTMPPTPRKTK